MLQLPHPEVELLNYEGNPYFKAQYVPQNKLMLAEWLGFCTHEQIIEGAAALERLYLVHEVRHLFHDTYDSLHEPLLLKQDLVDDFVPTVKTFAITHVTYLLSQHILTQTHQIRLLEVLAKTDIVARMFVEPSEELWDYLGWRPPPHLATH